MSQHCPTCNRPTRKRDQSVKDHPGTVVEYLADGTCPRCDMVAKGWTPKDPHAPRPKSPPTADADAVALRIREDRKARGIPEDGTTQLRIANTRGRTRRVPQLI